MMMAIDYIINGIPFVSLWMAWFAVPFIWIVCGKKWVVTWYGIVFLQQLPYQLGIVVTNIQTASFVQSNPNIAPLYIPYLTEIWVTIHDAFMKIVLFQMWMISQAPPFLQRWLALGYGLLIFFGTAVYFYWSTVIQMKHFLWEHLPFTSNWGVYSREDLNKMKEYRMNKQLGKIKKKRKKELEVFLS